MDNFNKNLLVNDWDRPSSRYNSGTATARVIPKVSQEQKINLKPSIFEGHIQKEPRERTTIAQKRVIKDRNLRISLESAGSALAGNSLTARGPESQFKGFIIKTSRGASKEKPGEEAKGKRRGESMEGENKQRGEVNMSRLKSSASVTTLAGSGLQTSRVKN